MIYTEIIVCTRDELKELITSSVNKAVSIAYKNLYDNRSKDETLITRYEVSQRLSISPQMVAYTIKKHNIATYKIKGKYLYKTKDINNLIEMLKI